MDGTAQLILGGCLIFLGLLIAAVMPIVLKKWYLRR